MPVQTVPELLSYVTPENGWNVTPELMTMLNNQYPMNFTNDQIKALFEQELNEGNGWRKNLFFAVCNEWHIFKKYNTVRIYNFEGLDAHESCICLSSIGRVEQEPPKNTNDVNYTLFISSPRLTDKSLIFSLWVFNESFEKEVLFSEMTCFCSPLN